MKQLLDLDWKSITNKTVYFLVYLISFFNKVLVKKISFKKYSKIHGNGLFASTYIKKGTKIIEYIGDKVTKKEGDRRADQQIQKAKQFKKKWYGLCFRIK